MTSEKYFKTPEEVRRMMQGTDGEIVYFFDLDGCLAQWEDVDIPRTKRPGFYITRKAQWNLVDAVRMMWRQGKKLFLLSKAYRQGTAAQEKMVWKDLVNLKDVPCILVPYEDGKKEDYVNPLAFNVLLDDYSRNLKDWENAGYTGIKFLNGLNGTKGTWHGSSVSYEQTAEQLCKNIIKMAEEAKKGVKS